jgi:hypothetical protein
MMVVDAVGKRYGRLVVVARAGSNKNKNAKWLCLCDCGNYTTVVGNKLRSGHTQSCGCLYVESRSGCNLKHGLKNHPLYAIWKDMRQRCNNENQTAYKNYGGRGIFVCDEWNDFQCFYDWANTNGYAPGLEIDRIDNSSGYYPENCRWTTRKQNNNNKRSNVLLTYNGRTQTVTQWAEELNVNVDTLYWRLRHWSDVEKILFTPVRSR